MKRVLVTGASGFIGRHALAPLMARGYEVHATSSWRDGEGDGVSWYRANLLDRAQTYALVDGLKPTHLLHLAWYTKHGKYWAAEANVDWLTASIELLRAFSDASGERAVVAGTCAEYDWSFGLCSEDATPMRAASLYGVCKSSLRLIGSHLATQHGFGFAWGHIFHLFGPNEAPRRLIPSVINSLLDERTIICSDNRKLRDFLYVEDVAEALVALLDSEVTGAVNIGSGVPVSLGAVVDAVAALMARPELVEWGKAAAHDGDPRVLIASVKRLREEVGWSPRWTLEGGLSQTLEWWRRIRTVEQ